MLKSTVLKNNYAFCKEQKELLAEILKEHGLDMHLRELESFYEKNIHKSQPEIMVYGIYNSGKSTLINALCREEVAAVGDVPLTDKIEKYYWNGYEITDTPGVDAPIRHQEVTEKHLKECAVVIFVMSSGGGFENVSNYKRMVDVIKTGKRLIIVVNDKAGIGNDLDAVNAVKAKVFRNLQVVGAEFGTEVNYSSYEVVFVDAKLACEGFECNDSEIVESSNLIELEQRILAEIKRVDGYAMAKIIVNEIHRIANEALIHLRNSGDDKTKVLTKLKEYLKNNKQSLKYLLNSKITATEGKLQDDIAKAIKSNLDNQDKMNDDIKIIVERYGNTISEYVEKEKQKIFNEMKESFEKKLLEIDQPNLQLTNQDISLATMNNNFNDDSTQFPYGGNDKHITTLNFLDQAASTSGKSVFAKKVITQSLTSIATSMGVKKYVAAYIPVVGQIVAAAMVINDIISFFAGDSDKKRREEDIEAARRANEQEAARAEAERQKIIEIKRISEEMCKDIIEQCKESLSEYINESFDTIISDIYQDQIKVEAEYEKLRNNVTKLHDIVNKCGDFTFVL